MTKILSVFTLFLDNVFELLGDVVVFILAAILMMLFYSLGILS